MFSAGGECFHAESGEFFPSERSCRNEFPNFHPQFSYPRRTIDLSIARFQSYTAEEATKLFCENQNSAVRFSRRRCPTRRSISTIAPLAPVHGNKQIEQPYRSNSFQIAIELLPEQQNFCCRSWNSFSNNKSFRNNNRSFPEEVFHLPCCVLYSSGGEQGISLYIRVVSPTTSVFDSPCVRRR